MASGRVHSAVLERDGERLAFRPVLPWDRGTSACVLRNTERRLSSIWTWRFTAAAHTPSAWPDSPGDIRDAGRALRRWPTCLRTAKAKRCHGSPARNVTASGKLSRRCFKGT